MVNPFKFIKHIKIHLKELKQEADSKLKNNVEFLDSGIWRVNNTLTVFYKKQFKKESQKETSNVVGALTKTSCDDNSTKIARKIFVKTYKLNIKNTVNTFGGQILITSTRATTDRIINYNDKTLLTKYAHLKLMKYRIDSVTKWGQYFNIAPIYKTDYEKLYSIEKYVARIDCSYELKLKHIFSDYLDFFKKNTETIKLTLDDIQKQSIIDYCKKNDNIEESNRIIEFLNNGGYVKCLSHGDLSYYNVLFDGEKNYYIDTECLNNRIFFYDIFQYIMWCKWFKNYSLIDKYFEGKFDKEFSELFSIFGLHFNPSYRKAYYLIMMCEEQFKL